MNDRRERYRPPVPNQFSMTAHSMAFQEDALRTRIEKGLAQYGLTAETVWSSNPEEVVLLTDSHMQEMRPESFNASRFTSMLRHLRRIGQHVPHTAMGLQQARPYLGNVPIYLFPANASPAEPGGLHRSGPLEVRSVAYAMATGELERINRIGPDTLDFLHSVCGQVLQKSNVTL